MWRTSAGACENSAMPPALSVIGPKVSIDSTYATVVSMPIVATAVPNKPGLTFWDANAGDSDAAWVPNQYDKPSAIEIMMAVMPVLSRPTAIPEMMLVAGPVREARASSCTGRQLPAV